MYSRIRVFLEQRKTSDRSLRQAQARCFASPSFAEILSANPVDEEAPGAFPLASEANRNFDKNWGMFVALSQGSRKASRFCFVFSVTSMCRFVTFLVLLVLLRLLRFLHLLFLFISVVFYTNQACVRAPSSAYAPHLSQQ